MRFTDKQSDTAVRDVDAHVWGDVDTPVTDVNGQLINDCRVHDLLTFQVPNDLAPAIYKIQVVVPNITGISAFGTELVSDGEFINVIPHATARFEIYTEWINARRETSPQSLGSDEVGLHTLAAAFDSNFQKVDLPSLQELNQRTDAQEQTFKDIQDVDFDSGTYLDITRKVFAPDKPILGMLLNDLATLTSSNVPAPDQTTFKSENGIVVNVNKTIPPEKIPLQYRETHEYVSDDQDSRYEITYRYNHVA